ncbi:MAG: hypothetical protein RO469_06505 [Thermincola sp.]|jgi:hypothetical protein|nr:hypothetical protein [Thermincola sp.]MDT3704443.1 hypothetical protein [Thermincola sp.]
MRRRTALIISSLVLLVVVIIAGKMFFTKDAGIKEPLKALDTYLQGLKEHDFKKVNQAVSNAVYYTVYEPSSEVLTKFEETLAEKEKEIGKTENWTFEPDPYFNEINNQAIITARITTSENLFVIEYDMRKFNHWIIYGDKTISQVSLDKDKKNVRQKVYQ